MQKLDIFLALFSIFIVYTSFVYTAGTEHVPISMNEKAMRGKLLFQKNNCTACHQLYGLGGYLGAELTTAISDRNRGELFCRAILKTGTQRMPNFHFEDNEVSDLIEFLKYIDSTALTYKETN